MSILKMGRFGFIALLATLVLVIGTAYYHSHKVIDGLSANVKVLGPAKVVVQDIHHLLTQSRFAFLTFIHRETVQAADVEKSFDRLVVAELDLIAGMPVTQVPAALKSLPARKARAMLDAFLEEEAVDPAADTAIQLADATRTAMFEVRQMLASIGQSPDSLGRLGEKREILGNLIRSSEFLFERYANRIPVTLAEALGPLNRAVKTLDAMPEMALASLSHAEPQRHPASAHPDFHKIHNVLKWYRAALFAYQDAIQAGMSGTTLIETRQVARHALHQAQSVLSLANQELARHVREIQEDSIAIGRLSQTQFIGIALLGAIASLGITLWVGAAITHRLANLAAAAEHISAGELGQHLEVASNDALGKVAIAFNQMSDKLRHREDALALHISELDDARQHLFEMNEELESRVEVRTRQLSRAKEEAESANRAKSDFLANMSHELRTPLNAIIGYAELLQEEVQDRGDEMLIDDLAKVRNAGRHLLGLISNVLDLSKVEAGMMEVDFQRAELAAVLSEIDDTVRPLVIANGNVFEISNTATADVFITDTQKLRQILLNLLGNAAKFTENGAVRLEITETPKGWLNFIVSDTGVGMRADQLGRILKPFTQANTEVSRQYGGTGLGLAITKGFAELMGGRLDVESEPGQGSRFTISLPIREMDKAGAARVSA